MGWTRQMNTPMPMEIMQEPNRVAILFEAWQTFKVIPTDGRDHPKDPDPTWMGNSVGHWEGDTLVIDTIALNDRTWLDTAGHQHSDKLHVIERLRRSAPDRIDYEYIVDDPVMYAKPWKQERVMTPLKPTPGLPELLEYECAENNKDLQHLISTKPR